MEFFTAQERTWWLPRVEQRVQKVLSRIRATPFVQLERLYVIGPDPLFSSRPDLLLCGELLYGSACLGSFSPFPSFKAEGTIAEALQKGEAIGRFASAHEGMSAKAGPFRWICRFPDDCLQAAAHDTLLKHPLLMALLCGPEWRGSVQERLFLLEGRGDPGAAIALFFILFSDRLSLFLDEGGTVPTESLGRLEMGYQKQAPHLPFDALDLLPLRHFFGVEGLRDVHRELLTDFNRRELARIDATLEIAPRFETNILRKERNQIGSLGPEAEARALLDLLAPERKRVGRQGPPVGVFEVWR